MNRTGFLRRTLFLALAGILCSVWGAMDVAHARDEPLKWQTISNESALCNDFSKAGFFHRNSTEKGAGKWIIFLESGSFCYSNETCNRRYFQSSVRKKYSGDNRANGRLGDFDTSVAYSAMEKRNGFDYVNPLMTSMSCFSGTRYFPNGRLELEGKDIFDRNTNSHVFRDHGHVLVPYCSSDVWLGSETAETRDYPQKIGDPDRSCGCFDKSCFNYDPKSNGLQFTFRGKTIFQSVVQDVDNLYDLRDARELILIGSSAGGLGVLNLAKWVTDNYPHLEVKVVSDSAWFINFRGGIIEQFTGLQDIGIMDTDPCSECGIVTSSSLSPTFKSQETSSVDQMQSSYYEQLSTTAVPGHAITSSTAIPGHVITSSTSIPGHVITSSAAIPGHVITSSATIPGHVITSSPTMRGRVISSSTAALSHVIKSSTEVPSTLGTFSSFLAPSSTHSTPTENFATPTPTLESPSSGSGSGSGESFSGSGMHEEVKRYATLEDIANPSAGERDRRNINPSTDSDLLSLLKSHEACYDTRRGYPCCLSAQCVLTDSNPKTNEPYFPRGVRLFVVTSLYDAFILSQAVQNVELYLSDSENNPIGLAIEYLTVVGEYGGAMDNSLSEVQDVGNVDLSVYMSQCFQHIYFVTSSLWGEGSVFGTDPVIIEPDIGTFRHSIQSGVWNTAQLAYMDGRNYTIMDAINVWYQNETETSIVFRDVCRTPHCNEQCPETFVFDRLQKEAWPRPVRLGIAAVVVFVAVISILFKTYFYFWLKWLEKKQNIYLRSVTQQEDEECMLPGYMEEGLKREFPICNADQAISVACLDLHYSVTTRVGKQLKDEKRENFAPIVLSDLSPEDELMNGSVADPREEEMDCDDLPNRASKTQSGDMGTFQRIRNALTPHSTGMYKVPTFRPENENLEESIHRMTNGNTTHKKSSITQPPMHGRMSRESNFSQDTYEEIPLNESRTSDFCSSMSKMIFHTKRKKILKGISVYFNPGEMIGIMGPSGCGKTTFLDILTGRRKTGSFSGQIFINGVPIEENQNWYVSNTGYVIQLARPYYDELTVRENLTLAAWIRLPATAREKFQRVEQVMDVSGLLGLANTVVGGATGSGLSGGQKRRLAVALQLLKLPSVIFLDEPTSGLDAASSRELLAHLNELAASNRTVVLTIHQPRLEIFHMFDRLVLLSDGKVAYHGVPDKAYEVFVNALRSRYLQQRLIIPDLEDRNPADVIMDMLGNQRMRQLITDYYQCTDEPSLVSRAVLKARTRERKYSLDLMDSGVSGTFNPPSKWERLKFILKDYRKAENTQNHLLARLATLEGRATKRATPFVVIYLPIIFFAYGILLGTVYLQQDQPFLIMSGFCVYSVASALFMFPALFSYYQKALEIYAFEHADGAGQAHDLVLQPFIRFITMAIIPVVACALILYVLLVDYTRWSWLIFGQLVIVNISLNQAWVALLIWLILSFPKIAIRLSPPLAAVMGFTSGFFIPTGEIPWWYRWLTYINPNYYGFSASAVLLLEDFETECDRSRNTTELECYPQSGEYILKKFDFNDVNPYYNITILLGMTIFFLLLSVISNWWNHCTLLRGMKKVRLIARRLKLAASIDTSSLFSTSVGDYGEYDSAASDDEGVSSADDLEDHEDLLGSNEPEGAMQSPLSPIAEKQEEHADIEREDLLVADSEQAKERCTQAREHPTRVPQRQESHTSSLLPTSLPEIPSAVSPNPRESVTLQSKSRERWRRIREMTLDQRLRENNIELDNFARSEPPTPQEKHVAFDDCFARRTARLNSCRDHKERRGHRNKSVRSVYLRDGEIHSVWKPKTTSLTSPTTPSPPPANFADVVHEVMRQKLNLRERQRKLFSRVTATQAVLKEQNEELAAVAEDEEDEKEAEEGSASDEGRTDTPSKKMWQQAIKTVMDENKNDLKNTKKDRKRSTVHFHEVVTNKLASMDYTGGTRAYPSVSEQSRGPQVPISPQKVKRNASLSRKSATTPSGAIPFTEWKNQYYKRQRLTRQEAMKQFRSDHCMKPPPFEQCNLPRINSDNNLTMPTYRRASSATVEGLEPRSKSVGQYHKLAPRRRSSSPDILDYDDHGEMSDTSMAIDEMFSPLSSRSVSPSVFSDEEERRSKLQARTPAQNEVGAVTTKSHLPLMKLNSEETRILSHPSNIKKRVYKRNQYRQMYQDAAHSADDIIEVDYPTAAQRKRRPNNVSISLPVSPQGTPSPRPSTPLALSRGASPLVGHGKLRRESIIPSPEILNDRISQEQTRRESLQHLPLLPEFSESEEHRVTPDASHRRPLSGSRRSSSPNILNPMSSGPPPPAQRGRRKSTPSPPPYAPSPRPKNIYQTPGGHGSHRHSPLPGNSNLTHTRV